MARETSITDRWQAEVLPLPASYENDPLSRPAVALVVTSPKRRIGPEWMRWSRFGPAPSPREPAARRVLYRRYSGRTPGDAAGVAEVLERAVMSAARAVGVLPAILQVSHPAVAHVLQEVFNARGVRVQTTPLVELLKVAYALGLDTNRSETEHAFASKPASWFAWGVDAAHIARLFDAAARVFHADPWGVVSPGTVVRVDLAQEIGTWVIGVWGDVPCVCLTGPAEPDWRGASSGEEPDIEIHYMSRDELPCPMQREIASAGWTVAGPDAYPYLQVIDGTPARGLTNDLADRLLRVLYAFASFVETDRSRIETRNGGYPIDWHDPVSGASVTHVPEAPLLWPLEDRLEPCLASGPNARPDALRATMETDELVDEADAVVARYLEHLERQGFGRADLRAHHRWARRFAHFLCFSRHVPLAAASERDLRLFLYDWLPRNDLVLVGGGADSISASLCLFFAYLAHDEGIVYAWAETIRDDTVSMTLRAARLPEDRVASCVMDAWEEELLDDLRRRALLPGHGTAKRTGWRSPRRDRARCGRLERLWLIWRDELIQAGVTKPETLRLRLEQKRTATH